MSEGVSKIMKYFVLLLPLFERLFIVWALAYAFSQTAIFWNMVQARTKWTDNVLFVLLFSGISILGTYVGIPLDEGAIANIRPLGPIVAGLIGGPWLGMAVGAIAGSHRWYLGGITGLACGIATVLEGLVGGLFHVKYKKNFLSLKLAFLAGVFGEVIQVLTVLLITKPFKKGLDIEVVVGLPMIIVNTVGVVGFIIIVREVFTKYSGMIVTQFNRFIEIEKVISEVMQKPLTKGSSQGIIDHIMAHTELKGLVLTLPGEVISFCGPETDLKLLSAQQSKFLVQETTKVNFRSSKSRLGVNYYCVPLVLDKDLPDWVLGVRLSGRSYYDTYITQFTDGLADLIQNQYIAALAKSMEEQMALSQLKALQAQIQPHFLFNSLSTISSLCRTDSNQARDLILDLASYFRKTISDEEQMISLEKELEDLGAYLRIEVARFGDKLVIEYDVKPQLMKQCMPTFMLQPLVENAIKHGIAHLVGSGTLRLVTIDHGDTFSIEVENTKASNVESCKGCGQALKNISKRLELIYKGTASFNLDTSDSRVTVARLTFPKGVEYEGVNLSHY